MKHRWAWILLGATTCGPQRLCDDDACNQAVAIHAGVRGAGADGCLFVRGSVHPEDRRAIHTVTIQESEARADSFNFRTFTATVVTSTAISTEDRIFIRVVDACACTWTSSVAIPDRIVDPSG